MSEISKLQEITEPCSCTESMTPCELHPRGVYMCNCGKKFHGHWNRVLHSSQCQSRIPEPTYTKADFQQIIEAIAVRVEGLYGFYFQSDGLARFESSPLLLRDEVLEAIRSTKI